MRDDASERLWRIERSQPLSGVFPGIQLPVPRSASDVEAVQELAQHREVGKPQPNIVGDNTYVFEDAHSVRAFVQTEDHERVWKHLVQVVPRLVY